MSAAFSCVLVLILPASVVGGNQEHVLGRASLPWNIAKTTSFLHEIKPQKSNMDRKCLEEVIIYISGF